MDGEVKVIIVKTVIPVIPYVDGLHVATAGR